MQIPMLALQEEAVGATPSAKRLRVALKVLQRKEGKPKTLPETDTALFAPTTPDDPPDDPRAKGLYRGHSGGGVGHLKRTMPERRDGDKDTVVGEAAARAIQTRSAPRQPPYPETSAAHPLSRSRRTSTEP